MPIAPAVPRCVLRSIKARCEKVDALSAPERDRQRFAPLFVLAPARSYSSVIVTMIGRHPDLVGLPEMKLFSYRTIGELERSLPSYWLKRGFTHRSPGLVRALAEFEFGGQTPEGIAAAREWLRARGHWSGTDVLDVVLSRVAPRGAVEKSPETVSSAAALNRLSAAYPNARYLHLTRHPATTQASAVQHQRLTVPEHWDPGEPMSGIAAWVRAHERILRFTASLPKEKMLRVRAEDVLNDAPTKMRAIAGWLGLRTDAEGIEAMLHPELSPFANFGPMGSGVIGGHDHGFLRDPIPRRVDLPGSVEKPRGWIGQPKLWGRAEALARRLGYVNLQAPTRREQGVARGVEPRLREELLRRADNDRAAREAYTGAPAEMARLMEIDADNTAWLLSVVERSGWPDRSEVGDDGAHAAWRLAQHADRNLPAQRRFLELLQSAVARGDASPADLARLTDRVALASGQQQVYGTQLAAHAGRYVATKLRDPKNVDARRADVGLEPLAEQIEGMRLSRAPPRSAPAICPGCGETIQISPPAPGRTTRFRCRVCGATGNVRARCVGATVSPR
jgi:Sulfotransferase family